MKKILSRIKHVLADETRPIDITMPHKEQYDSIYSSYQMNPSPEIVPWRVTGPNEQLIKFLEQFKLSPPMNILDLGCGTGKNSKYLSEKGFNVVGIDFSDAALRLATKLGVKSPLIVADAAYLPFKEKVFDLVLDMGCLHSIPPSIRERVKNEILRVLEHQGTYFLRTWSSKARLIDHTQIGKPMWYIHRKIPIWAFDLSLIDDMFLKDFKIEYMTEELDEDNYGPFLLLFLRARD